MYTNQPQTPFSEARTALTNDFVNLSSKHSGDPYHSKSLKYTTKGPPVVFTTIMCRLFLFILFHLSRINYSICCS